MHVLQLVFASYAEHHFINLLPIPSRFLRKEGMNDYSYLLQDNASIQGVKFQLLAAFIAAASYACLYFINLLPFPLSFLRKEGMHDCSYSFSLLVQKCISPKK